LKEENIPEGKPMEFQDLTEIEVASNAESEDMSKLTDVDMDTTDVQPQGDVYSIPEEDDDMGGPKPAEETLRNANDYTDRETSLSKAAKMGSTIPNMTETQNHSIHPKTTHSEHTMTEYATKADWVTPPHKRSPRHNDNQERESKTHRKGSPQKSPHSFSQPDNRYSPLLDNATDLMDHELTERKNMESSQEKVFASGDVLESGYETEITSNISHRMEEPQSHNHALDQICEHGRSSPMSRWGDSDDEELSNVDEAAQPTTQSDPNTNPTAVTTSQYNFPPPDNGGYKQ
jgi:hypothetical protein